VVELRTDEGAAGAGQAEHDAWKHPDPTGSQVGEHPAEGGGAHDHQRGGGGGLRAFAGRVDEDGDGEDRPAAAEGPE
jgi:hypothetical protein